MPRPEATQAFIARVLSEVRWKQAHKSIARELSDHVEDQSRAFAAEGMGEAEAERAAIRDMGDPLTLGTAFDAAYRPRPTWQMLLPMGVLLATALLLHVLLYAPMEHYEAYADETVIKEILALAIGGLAFTLAYFMNFNWYRWLCCGLAALVLFMVWTWPDMPLRGDWELVWYRLFYGNQSIVPYALPLLPLALTGTLTALRKLGVWGVLIIDAALFIGLTGCIAGDRWIFLIWLCASMVMLAAAILMGVCRGRKWPLLLTLLLPIAAGVTYMLKTGNSEWNGLDHLKALWTPYACPDVRALIESTRWFGRGSLERLSASAVSFYGLDPSGDWFQSSNWGFATQQTPLYLCFYYGRIVGLIAAALPAAAVGIGR